MKRSRAMNNPKQSFWPSTTLIKTVSNNSGCFLLQILEEKVFGNFGLKAAGVIGCCLH